MKVIFTLHYTLIDHNEISRMWREDRKQASLWICPCRLFGTFYSKKSELGPNHKIRKSQNQKITKSQNALKTER